MLKAQK